MNRTAVYRLALPLLKAISLKMIDLDPDVRCYKCWFYWVQDTAELAKRLNE